MIDKLFLYMELVSGITCFLITLFLAFLTVPDTEMGKRNRRACLFVEISSLIMGCVDLVFVFLIGEHRSMLVAFFIQGFVPLQTLLLMLTLSYPIYIGNKLRAFMWRHLGYACMLAVCNMVYYWEMGGQVGTPVYYLLLACYVVLMAIYARVYLRIAHRWLEHHPYRREHFRKRVYPLCAVLCATVVYALIINIFPTHVNQLIFVVVYTVVYIYFAIQFHNYGLIVSDYKPVSDEDGKAGDSNLLMKWIGEKGYKWKRIELHYGQIEEKLDAWKEQKKFLSGKQTIHSVSQDLGVNQTYLSNFINDRYGMNFNRWINSLRIDEAKQLMVKEPDANLAEVAEGVGFADLAHFSKQFKMKEGCSPSVWRRHYEKSA